MVRAGVRRQACDAARRLTLGGGPVGLSAARGHPGSLVDQVDVLTPYFDYIPPDLVSLFVTNMYGAAGTSLYARPCPTDLSGFSAAIACA